MSAGLVQSRPVRTPKTQRGRAGQALPGQGPSLSDRVTQAKLGCRVHRVAHLGENANIGLLGLPAENDCKNSTRPPFGRLWPPLAYFRHSEDSESPPACFQGCSMARTPTRR